MSGFTSSSIGKKFFMSITGLFLILFLSVHLIANLGLLFGSDAFNKISHFMGTNPMIQIMQPVLALGFILHMVYATVLTLQNMKARPQNYAKVQDSHQASWASRNMFILGSLIFIFLVLHLFNFFWKMKVSGSPLLAEVEVDGVHMENAYALVAGLFNPDVAGSMAYAYAAIYALGAIFLGLHITHGFWSAFQTIGLSNNIWRKRLSFLAKVFAFIIGGGFFIIPIFLMFIK